MTKTLVQSARQQPCDLCGRQVFDLVATTDRHGAPLNTVICRHCGLVSHEQTPTEQELSDYYARAYRWEYHGEYTPSAYRVLREWKRGREFVQLLTDYLHPRDRILEIGCGIGCTVKNFELAGWTASGLEPGDGFRRFAQESLKTRVADGVLADVPAGANLNMVLLIHVLEHLPHPTSALTRIRSAMAAHGRLYVEVPNAGAPHAAPGKMFHYAHIFNFSQQTLGMLAGKAGFEVVAWLSKPGDKNLSVLLQRSARPDRGVVPGSYQKMLAATTGQTVAGYHLRWSYLRSRLGTAVGHRRDRLMAKTRLKSLLRHCAAHPADPDRDLWTGQVADTNARRSA